jgi:hypothetical protein
LRLPTHRGSYLRDVDPAIREFDCVKPSWCEAPRSGVSNHEAPDGPTSFETRKRAPQARATGRAMRSAKPFCVRRPINVAQFVENDARVRAKAILKLVPFV